MLNLIGTHTETIKSSAHAVQALFIFVLWTLIIAIFTKGGYSGGQITFPFALCFISIPFLVYQVAVPHFPRAQRFASIYAYAIVDVLFTILWFSAAICIAAWTAAGINQEKASNSSSDGTCSYFAFGDASKCNVSRAGTAFAFLICFLFAFTAVISLLIVRRYRTTGELPKSQARLAYAPTSDAMGKGAWSTSVEDRGPEYNEDRDERRKYGQLSEHDEQGLLPTYGMHSGPHPGLQMNLAMPIANRSAGQQYDSHVPSALSSSGYDNDDSTAYQPHTQHMRSTPLHAPLDFPAGRYERV